MLTRLGFRAWLRRLFGEPTTHQDGSSTASAKLSGAADSPLVAQFIPSLSAVLLNAEMKKGAPLLEAEVMAIRDRSSVVMVTPAMARDVDEKRGYIDIDPEHCWQQYLQLREDQTANRQE